MALIGHTNGIRELDASDGNVSFSTSFFSFCYILLDFIRPWLFINGMDCVGAETSETH